MTRTSQKAVFINRWKQIYKSPVFVFIRFIVATILLSLGVFGLMLTTDGPIVWENLIISTGCFSLAALMAWELTVIILSAVTLIALTKMLPVSSAIVIGAIIVAAAILVVHLKKGRQ